MTAGEAGPVWKINRAAREVLSQHKGAVYSAEASEKPFSDQTR